MGLKGKGRELSISARLLFPISNHATERTARVEVRDETAGIVLLEFELDPTQLMALLAGSAAYATAWMPTRLDHVGKRMETGHTLIGKKYKMTEEAADAAATAWAAENGWETVDLRADNQANWTAIGRRWVDPE